MGFSVFVILFTCTVGFDQHSYTNGPEDEAEFSKDPDVHRYNDRRPLDDDGNGDRDADDARSYAKGPRARSLSQRPAVQSEEHDSDPDASFDLRPRGPKSKALDVDDSSPPGTQDEDAATPRRLEDREPRWRASPTLRRQRVEASDARRYDERYQDDADFPGDRRGRPINPARYAPEEESERRFRGKDGDNDELQDTDRRGSPRGFASHDAPDRGFLPESLMEDRTERADREVERIDRDRILKEDRDEDFDQHWERLKRDRKRYHHSQSLVDETALYDTSDSHDARADREDNDAYDDRAASKSSMKRWTRASMHRSDEGREVHHNRPRFVYDWQEDGGIVDCPPGGCKQITQTWADMWTWPYWVDGPGFKLALASFVALVFLYVLQWLNAPRFSCKGNKSGWEEKRYGARAAGRSADPSEGFGPGVSRIRSIHQIETDSEDEDESDESGDEVAQDERPSGKQGRKKPRRGRKEAGEGSKRREARKKSRAKPKRTGTD